MTLLFLLLFAAVAVGAANVDVEPCLDGVELLGPLVLVGMQHPEHASTVSGHSTVIVYNYAAHACGAWTCCTPATFAFAASPGQGDCM